MSEKEVTGERVSAFADGELADELVDEVLAALRRPDGKADWDMYHQIGDVLRSEDMAIRMSPDFAARMAARLEAEPTVIAPAAGVEAGRTAGSELAAGEGRPRRRWAVPGMVAAAAMASVAFVATPQLMVAMKGDAVPQAQPVLASDAKTAAASLAAAVGPSASVVTAVAPEGVVLRDARLDDYLLAHQRFSPSIYSTAQYARSATFASGTDK